LKGEGLVVPSTQLMSVCTIVEKSFRGIVEKVFHMDCIKARIVSAIKNDLSERLTCTNCCTLDLVVHLNVNIRLHHVLRESNRELISCKGKTSRKYLKLKHV